MQKDPVMDRLVDHIRRAVPEIVAIYAYGSQVRGGSHPESDLDLALLLPRSSQISPTALLDLQGDLETVAGVPVDISILSIENGVVLCKEVISTGQQLFAADPAAVDEFEMRVLSSYARLCEDRAVVVEAYSRAGHG
jgi:uncharacterized protein